MDSQVEQIKNKLNVLDVVGGYVKLTKTGVNYRGICPFHSEKGPSFFVSPGRQMWKCFGCGKGGDIFEFIKEIEGIEFGDALRILANKAGIELKRENPEVRSGRKRLYEICNLACSFFEKQLSNSSIGKEAEDYLLKRGITKESIKKWRLGYSPDTWQGLSDFLVGRGYNRDEILKAGLAVKSEKGNDSYDRFRGRIIFPIFDSNSQVVGFGARVFKEADKKETAKYINTPQTMLYDKSNVLYGINYAKVAIRKNNRCVLTEGYTDAIMCHQAGFEDTVAVSGTALTPNHLNILKRYTDNLLLSFDMDVAGDTATKRGINLAESQGFNIKIIDTYNNAKDPAEIILDNPSNWEESVKNARSIMDFYFDSAFSKFNKDDPKDKKEIAKIILPGIKRLQNKIEQSHWIQKLASKLSVSQESIIDELRNTKIDQTLKINQPDNKVIIQEKPLGRKKLIEDKIISLVLKNPENLDLIDPVYVNFFSEKAISLIEDMKKSYKERGNNHAIFADIQKEEYKDLLDALALKAEVDYHDDGEEEIQLCLSQLKDIELRNKLSEISYLIQEESDEKKKQDLIKEFNNKAIELHQKI